MGRPITEEQKWAMLIHGAAALGFIVPFGNLLFPYLIWKDKVKQFPRLQQHGLAAMNFQLSMTLYFLVAFVLLLFFIGIFFLIALCVFQLLCIFLAVLEAHDMEVFDYKFSIKVIEG